MDPFLYDISIPAISSLQSSMSPYANFMQLTSTVFDPKYAFLIYSPLAYLIDPKVGKKLIMTTVIAEWLNMILKWFLHGERPYWYVHSSGHFDPSKTPISQFPITCELGPGHPSGHAMVTAAVWYIILSSLLEAYQGYRRQMKQEGRVQNGLAVTLPVWSLYGALLVVVSVSRVFLGCHFPHQCLAGAALGLLVSRYISSRQIKAHHYVIASVFLLATAFTTFALLQMLGFDPSWTIKLATKHCVKREYIHLDTAPFFSVMRYCGFALGCGLGLMFPLHKGYANKLAAIEGQSPDQPPVVVRLVDDEAKNPFSSGNISWFSFKLVMALLMARLVDNLGLFVSHTNLSMFYSCALVAYTLFAYAFVNL
uniref:glucose-6-phosphatase n=1 Tax=Aceria tosichella TaxID=561515 RepID=A0A6G1SJM0_9ACAR